MEYYHSRNKYFGMNYCLRIGSICKFYNHIFFVICKKNEWISHLNILHFYLASQDQMSCKKCPYLYSARMRKEKLEKLRIRPLFMQCKWTVLLRYFELAHLFPMHSLSAPWKHQKTADFFRCGTDFYMSLFSVLPSVLLSVRPSVAHHISGTVHHVILIFGTHV